MVDRESLRATVSEYGESDHKSENSNFLLVVRQNYSLVELFSKIYLKSFSENVGKLLNQPSLLIEFMQNCAFSTGQYRNKGTCLISYSTVCNLRFI